MGGITKPSYTNINGPFNMVVWYCIVIARLHWYTRPVLCSPVWPIWVIPGITAIKIITAYSNVVRAFPKSLSNDINTPCKFCKRIVGNGIVTSKDAISNAICLSIFQRTFIYRKICRSCCLSSSVKLYYTPIGAPAKASKFVECYIAFPISINSPSPICINSCRASRRIIPPGIAKITR